MSTDDRSPLAMRIFEQVADLPPERRATRLDELCAGDAGLRALVEAMLAADARPDEPFGGNGAQWHEELRAESTPEAPAAQPGRTIGAWRIVGELGRGGMGAVYAVQRSDGAYAQQAALKLIRSAADSPAARERFLRERQLLAQLHHPHIATLLDGGFSAEGDPYFVMEYVDGLPIDQWCDIRRLGLRERVELFLQALDAVSCAHRNLVVHRDLKPSNLLVDAGGQVKLLDFGIAKQLEGAAATATSDRALTFEYASPEQLHAAPITTATDIWQLGIVLHRLLSGSHPFGLSRDTPLPRQLQLLEREPEPLTRAAAQAPSEQAALRGGLSPESLARDLRGPLSQIVQGCLRRTPEGRYASVDALADDLRRWAGHRPLRIVPPSRAARARLWLRRNRILATAASVTLLAVLGGSGAALWQAREAERQGADARAALDFLTGLLGAAEPEQTLSAEVSVRQLLDTTRTELDGNDSLSVPARQRVQRVLGALYYAWSDVDTAGELLEAGLENVQDPGQGDEALRLAGHLTVYSAVLAAQDRHEESLQALERADRLRQRHVPGDPKQRLYTLSQYGMAYARMGDHGNAEKRWRQALAIGRGMDEPPVRTLASVYQALAHRLYVQGKYEQATALVDEGFDLIERHDFPERSVHRIRLLRLRSDILIRTGDSVGAEKLLREAIALQERSVGNVGETMTALHNALGNALAGQGRYLQAAQAQERSYRLQAEAGGKRGNVAILLGNMATAWGLAGDYPQAMALFERAFSTLDQARIGPDEPVRRRTGRQHARVLVDMGRDREAAVKLQALAEQARRLDGEDSVEYAELTRIRVLLAQRMRDPEAGRAALDEAVARQAARHPDSHPTFAKLMLSDAAFARMRGDSGEAERKLRVALARTESGQNLMDLAKARADLAAVRYERGDRAEAERLLGLALPVMRESVLSPQPDRAEAEALARKLGLPAP